MIEDFNSKEISDLLLHQLKNWWNGINEEKICQAVPKALEQMESNYSAMSSPRFYFEKNMVFNPLFSVTWMIFLYRMSRILYLGGGAI